MPVVSSIDGDHHSATIGVLHELGIVRMLGQPYLKRVDGCANVFDREASVLPDYRVSAVSAYDQVGAHF
jgi:hypothetical protein